jgi:hypothetical protein
VCIAKEEATCSAINTMENDDPFVKFHLQFAVMLREWTEMILDKTEASGAIRKELLDKCQFYERKIRDIVKDTCDDDDREVSPPSPPDDAAAKAIGDEPNPHYKKKKTGTTLDSIIQDLCM